MKLEATKLRKAIHRTCCKKGATCTGCPYRFSCEEQFPYIPSTVRKADLLPCDYKLAPDKLTFIAEV